MEAMPGMMNCSRCGAPTAGVELSPGSISAVCRPGTGCEAKPHQVKKGGKNGRSAAALKTTIKK